MTKKITLIFTIVLMLLLTACGSQSTATDTVTTASGTPVPGSGMGESMQLVMGVLSLADSDTPLTAEQAAAMLPLWKAVRSLGESDTAAQAEIDALYTQIRGTLTAEQLIAIDAMTLDGQSMASLAEALGINPGVSAGFGGGMRGTTDPELQATRQALRESAALPEGFTPPEGVVPGSGEGLGGGMGGGGGMFGGGAGLTQEQMATAQASGARPPEITNTVSGPWLEALIVMLEGIVAGQ